MHAPRSDGDKCVCVLLKARCTGRKVSRLLVYLTTRSICVPERGLMSGRAAVANANSAKKHMSFIVARQICSQDRALLECKRLA